MCLLAWIFIGVLIGWGAGRDLPGNGYGPFMDVVMGIRGAIGGGYFMRSAGHGGTLVTTLFAVICALLLTILAGFATGRRFYALQH